jgi:hypothetical protein
MDRQPVPDEDEDQREDQQVQPGALDVGLVGIGVQRGDHAVMGNPQVCRDRRGEDQQVLQLAEQQGQAGQQAKAGRQKSGLRQLALGNPARQHGG